MYYLEANIAVLGCSRWEKALTVACFLACAIADPGAEEPLVSISLCPEKQNKLKAYLEWTC